MTYFKTALETRNIILTNDDCDPPIMDRPDLTTDFTTTPSTPLTFPGKWMVTLSELTISGNIYNIPRNTPITVKIRIKKPEETSYVEDEVTQNLEPGIYHSMEELIDKIYELFSHIFMERTVSLKDLLSIRFISQTNTISLQKLPSPSFLPRGFVFAAIKLNFEGELRYILGTGEQSEINISDNDVIYLPYKTDLYRGVNKFFILTNMIEKQHIGNSYGQILRMVPINYKTMNESRMLYYSADAFCCSLITNSEFQLPFIRIRLVEDVLSETYIRLEEGSSVTINLLFIRYE